MDRKEIDSLLEDLRMWIEDPGLPVGGTEYAKGYRIGKTDAREKVRDILQKHGVLIPKQ